MKLNLDVLRSEILRHIESRGIAIFHGVPQGSTRVAAVYWDTQGHPEYQSFLDAAESAGVRLVTLYANEFSEDLIEDAFERLHKSALPGEERRTIEARLREMRGYTGFTCQIELSFDIAPRIYIFDLRTEWFEDLNEMLDRIDEGYQEQQEQDQERLGGGGYFSNN